MFRLAGSFNQNISNWNVSNVTSLNETFSQATSFNQDISNWNVSSVTNLNSAFYGSSNFNQDLTDWCVTNITSEPSSFSSSSALTNENKPIWGTCPDYNINVTASSNSDYTLSGSDRNGTVTGNDPSITINVGDEINFIVDAASHPFYIKTVQGTGTDNLASNVTNNGATSGVVNWTPTTAGTYYYQCSVHNGMYGTITVQ
jgi:surface protein